MSTWKDFPKILFLLEKANEYLGGGPDSQNCRDFLHAYLIDISTEEAEDDNRTLYELSAAEFLLGTLTEKQLLALTREQCDIHDDLLKKYPILESVDKVLHVYQQLKMIKDHQYASVLAATNADTAQLEFRSQELQSDEFRSESRSTITAAVSLR